LRRTPLPPLATPRQDQGSAKPRPLPGPHFVAVRTRAGRRRGERATRRSVVEFDSPALVTKGFVQSVSCSGLRVSRIVADLDRLAVVLQRFRALARLIDDSAQVDCRPDFHRRLRRTAGKSSIEKQLSFFTVFGAARNQTETIECGSII